MNVTVVHKASAGDHSSSESEVVSAVGAAGHRVAYRAVEDDWTQHLEHADLVVAAGGDGTVSEIFKTLAGHDIAIAVLPLGTANNIATSLGIETDDPYASIWLWPQWRPCRFDIPNAHFGQERAAFIERVGCGLLSTLLEAAEDEERERGSDFTVDEALQLFVQVLDRANAQPWALTIDGRDYTGDYLAIEVMNISHTGPSIALANQAAWGDGLVDVTLIADRHRSLLRDYIHQRLDGRDPPALDLPSPRGRSVCVGSRSEALLHLDDAIVGNVDGLLVVPGTGQVTVLAPKS